MSLTATSVRYEPATVLTFAEAMLQAVGRAEAWPAQADPDEPGGILLGEAASIAPTEDDRWAVSLAAYDPGWWDGRRGEGAPPSIEWDLSATYATTGEAIREAILCLLRQEMEDAAEALEAEEWERRSDEASAEAEESSIWDGDDPFPEPKQ